MEGKIEHLISLSEGGGFSGQLADQILSSIQVEFLSPEIRKEYEEWLDKQFGGKYVY